MVVDGWEQAQGLGFTRASIDRFSYPKLKALKFTDTGPTVVG